MRSLTTNETYRGQKKRVDRRKEELMEGIKKGKEKGKRVRRKKLPGPSAGWADWEGRKGRVWIDKKGVKDQTWIVFIAIFAVSNYPTEIPLSWRVCAHICASVAHYTFFLDATSHLYKRSCPSVRPSVGWSVPRYFRTSKNDISEVPTTTNERVMNLSCF